MVWDILSVQAITGQSFANANQLTSTQRSYLGAAGEVNLVAGATYYISGWARYTAGSANSLTVGLETTAPDGSGTTRTGYVVPMATSSTWYRFSSTITIPSGHNKGRCYAEAASGATVQYAAFYCGLTPADGSLSKAITPSTGSIKPAASKHSTVGNMVRDYSIADPAYWTLGTGWEIDTTSTDVIPGASTKLGVSAAFKTPVDGVGATSAISASGVGDSSLYEEIEPGTVYYMSCRSLAQSGFRGQLRASVVYYKKDGVTGNISLLNSVANAISIGSSSDYRDTPAVAATVTDIKNAIRAPLLSTIGTLTFTANPANNSTVTIQGKVYTFKTTLTGADGEVFIGAVLQDSITNLVHAINLTGVIGTNYGASTLKHVSVTGQLVPKVPPATTYTAMYCLANEGIAGSAVTTTVGGTINASWGSGTLQTDTGTLLMCFRPAVWYATIGGTGPGGTGADRAFSLIASSGNVLTTTAAHGITVAKPLIFTNVAGMTGITAGVTYYAIVPTTTTFKIATSVANANAGTAVTISGTPTTATALYAPSGYGHITMPSIKLAPDYASVQVSKYVSSKTISASTLTKIFDVTVLSTGKALTYDLTLLLKTNSGTAASRFTVTYTLFNASVYAANNTTTTYVVNPTTNPSTGQYNWPAVSTAGDYNVIREKICIPGIEQQFVTLRVQITCAVAMTLGVGSSIEFYDDRSRG